MPRHLLGAAVELDVEARELRHGFRHAQGVQETRVGRRGPKPAVQQPAFQFIATGDVAVTKLTVRQPSAQQVGFNRQSADKLGNLRRIVCNRARFCAHGAPVQGAPFDAMTGRSSRRLRVSICGRVGTQAGAAAVSGRCPSSAHDATGLAACPCPHRCRSARLPIGVAVAPAYCPCRLTRRSASRACLSGRPCGPKG